MPITRITPEEADALGIPRSTTVIGSVPVRKVRDSATERDPRLRQFLSFANMAPPSP
jgi:hypothetical protein